MPRYLGKQRINIYLGADIIREPSDFSIYDPIEFPLTYNTAGFPVAASTDGHGNVWTAFGGGGVINHFDKDTKVRTVYALSQSASGCIDRHVISSRVGNDIWYCFCRGNNQQSDLNIFNPAGIRTATSQAARGADHMKGCVTDKQGRFWVAGGSGQRGINVFSGNIENPTNFTLDAVRQYPALACDGDGNVWIGQGSSVLRYNPSGQFTSFQFSQNKGTVRTMYPAATHDRQGHVWYIQGNTADVFTPGGIRRSVRLPHSFPTPGATVDNRGNIWVAGGINVNIITPNNEIFEAKLTKEMSRPSLTVDGNGDVWVVGTDVANVFRQS
jgi:sugar lactone lactonase YvrE